MRKGQAAMEFLMTYGWAILVVLIAIGALAYFGFLNPNKLLSDRCVITSGSGMDCQDYNADVSANTVTLRIRNLLDRSIIIGASGGSLAYDIDGTTGTCTSGAVTINPGSSGDLAFNACGLTGNTGKKLKGDATITYTLGTGGLTKTTAGSLIVTIGA